MGTITICYYCHTPYDATDAAWCELRSHSGSPACTNCGRCICDAPTGYRDAFWINAPEELWLRKRASERAPAEFVNPPPRDVQRPLILFVDDEADARTVAIEGARVLGFGIICASDAREGIELARTYQPALVLADARTKGLDPASMFRQLRSDPQLRDMRIAVMSPLHRGSRQRLEAARQFGADDLLSKPLEAAHLHELLLNLSACESN